MPGLVNCHCHSPMTLFRGAAEDLPLMRFLQDVLWPREAKLTTDDVYWGMTLACAELLRNGVTTTCEMYTHEEGILRAVLEAGTRCVLTPGVIDLAAWDMAWERRLADVLRFHDEHAGRHDRVEIGIAAHAYYTLPPEGLQAVAAAARERDALLHIHVAETREEAEHPARLAELGVFGGRVLAAHSVWLDDAALALYREHDVAVAHCPQANAKLASGIARLADLLRLGLRVGLGTDSAAANNDLDLWEELRLAPLLAKLQTGDAAAVPAAEALALATRKGAAALGRADLGALEPGRRADMVLLRLDDLDLRAARRGARPRLAPRVVGVEPPRRVGLGRGRAGRRRRPRAADRRGARPPRGRSSGRAGSQRPSSTARRSCRRRCRP